MSTVIYANEYYKKRIGKIYILYYVYIVYSIISYCGIFVFYHTWYDFPNMHILPLMVL